MFLGNCRINGALRQVTYNDLRKRCQPTKVLSRLLRCRFIMVIFLVFRTYGEACTSSITVTTRRKGNFRWIFQFIAIRSSAALYLRFPNSLISIRCGCIRTRVRYDLLYARTNARTKIRRGRRRHFIASRFRVFRAIFFGLRYFIRYELRIASILRTDGILRVCDLFDMSVSLLFNYRNLIYPRPSAVRLCIIVSSETVKPQTYDF